MMSTIEIHCPHCGAPGEITIPPLGSIIIGPCPECEELVVVFCGHVLPLDKELMNSANATPNEKIDHLLDALTKFLHGRVTKIIMGEEDVLQLEDSKPPNPTTEKEITETEIERFTDVDLKLLDNVAYFRSVFEQN